MSFDEMLHYINKIQNNHKEFLYFEEKMFQFMFCPTVTMRVFKSDPETLVSCITILVISISFVKVFYYYNNHNVWFDVVWWIEMWCLQKIQFVWTAPNNRMVDSKELFAIFVVVVVLLLVISVFSLLNHRNNCESFAFSQRTGRAVEKSSSGGKGESGFHFHVTWWHHYVRRTWWRISTWWSNLFKIKHPCWTATWN